MDSKDYQIYLTGNGLVGGAQKLLTYQGDADIDTGQGINRTPYKGKYAYTSQVENGMQITVSLLLLAAMSEGAEIAYDAAQNNDDVYLYYQSTTPGAKFFHGKFRVAMTKFPGAVDGAADGEFVFSQSATITWAETV